jgi:hypothetical protein
VASGKKNPTDLALGSIQFDPSLLELYAQVYLPREIVEWGGDLRDMFPETCRRLDERGILLMTFVDFWFRAPRAADIPYDFFLLKVERFVEFIREVIPDSMEMVLREANDLRGGYQDATEGVGIGGGRS